MTICVATFGAGTWRDLAFRRAIPSAEKQGVPVVYRHAATLAAARNQALAQVDTEWVVHLDADDELTDGYVAAMLASTGDVRVPATARPHPRMRGRYLRPPAHWKVRGHLHQCHAGCLPFGDWVPVGAMAPAELLRAVGGWRDWAMFEDWDLWLRCHTAGATFEPSPAVYVNHLTPRSRNHPADLTIKTDTHRAIAAANGYQPDGRPLSVEGADL